MALAWGALGTLLFTLTYASSKLTGAEVSAFQIMFIRYVSGTLTVLFIIKARKEPLSELRSNTPRFHLYRSFCGSMGGICIVHASAISPIADVTAIGLTDGLLTVVLSIIFLRERLENHQLIGASLCCLGAVIVVYGASDSELLVRFSTGLLLALLGALLVSIESVLIKILTFNEKPLAILLYVNFFSMLLTAVPGIYHWSALSLEQITFFVLLGPIAIFAQYCWVVAYSLEDVAVVTPINYLWIVFAAILGYLVFDETLGVYTLLGSVLITLGGIILARRSIMKN